MGRINGLAYGDSLAHRWGTFPSYTSNRTDSDFFLGVAAAHEKRGNLEKAAFWFREAILAEEEEQA